MPELFPYERWEAQLPGLAQKHQQAQPYPHSVLYPFLENETALAAAREFPKPEETSWIQYKHFNEKKLGKSNREEFPPLIGRLVDEFSSPRFLSFLSRLSGIDGLMADPMLNGGGMHQTQRGGFLNMHADFITHHHRPWRRRLNLIFFLNEGWKEEWKGWLEMWDREMRRCVERVLPVLNTAVLFNTDEFSFHGVPQKLACPPGETRKSLALYYYTPLEQAAAHFRSTHYVSRPGERWKTPFIWLDTQLVLVYSLLKKKFGLSDDWTSKVFGIFRSRKK